MMNLRPPLLYYTALLLIAFGLCGCFQYEPDESTLAQIEELKAETDSLQQSVETLKSEKREIDSKLRRNGNVDRELASKVTRSQPSVDYMADLIAGVDFYDEKLNVWREATRASFVGVRINQLDLVDGETLRSVTIKQVEDDEVVFTFPDGTTKTVPCSNLPKPFLKRIAHESTILEEANTL